MWKGVLGVLPICILIGVLVAGLVDGDFRAWCLFPLKNTTTGERRVYCLDFLKGPQVRRSWPYAQCQEP